MPDVHLFLVTATGPQRVQLKGAPASIHDLPEELPLGVYTVFRTFEHNRFLGLEHHLERIRQSMAILEWEYVLDEGALRRALDRVCTAYPHPEARVRVDVLAAPAPQLGHDSRLLLTLAPFTPVPDHYYERGVQVGTAPQLRRQQPQAKKADFVLTRRQFLERQPEAFDYLLLTEQGAILEASSSNFYAVRQNTVWTAGEAILEGITRRIVLQLVAELEIALRIQPVLLEEIDGFDEAFLSSSSRGLLPVVAVGDRKIGAGKPGPVTRRLMAAYAAYVKQAIQPAVAHSR